MDDDLEKALAAIVTRDALRELAERYARGVDHRDRELYLSVFFPDATVEVVLPSSGDDELLVQRGHEEIGPIHRFHQDLPEDHAHAGPIPLRARRRPGDGRGLLPRAPPRSRVQRPVELRDVHP